MKIKCPYFTELVKFEQDGEYMIAHGWTQSTGQNWGAQYVPTAGWRFDERFSDIVAGGGHGGCTGCAMALVHLISTDEVDGGIPWLYIGAAVAVVYMLMTR